MVSAEKNSLPESISAALKSGFKLNINQLDAAFLVGIHTYAEIEHTFSLKGSELENIYHVVNQAAGGNSDLVQQKAQKAVNRLIKNQLLMRVDGGGLSQQPLFDMSSLGEAIVSFISNAEILTKQNLSIIASRIHALLADIRKSIQFSGSGQYWEESVIQPLKHVVVELLNAIEKRQRGLDQEQEEVRAQIAELLEKSWLEALENCESLLDTTGHTLQELYRTLLSENTAIKQGLNEIFEAAEELKQNAVLEIIELIFNRLDHLEQWGKERVASWSQYYRRVNDFLQSIVRFDPNRELSAKLKDSIQQYPDQPWFMSLIVPPIYRGLQEISYSVGKKRTTRQIPQNINDSELDDDGNLVLDLMINEIKSRLEKKQDLDLREIIKPYIEEYSLDKVYPHIGVLIDIMLKEINQKPLETKDWVKPLEKLQFEIQNLIISEIE